MSIEPGYYRHPAISQDVVVFVCEDDLWRVPAAGGEARRLTANPGHITTPALSPDGSLLAFAGRDEGQTEVYVMPAAGGPVKRLTHLGSSLAVVGWHPDGRIIFASDVAQPFRTFYHLFAISPQGGEPQRLPTGPAVSLSFGPKGKAVLGRNTTDIARWKRYRGGQTGALWVDRKGDSTWQPLLQLEGNVASPLWLGKRIYFVSDHEGTGNLYSCRPTGKDLQKHTHHADYYVRFPATDGKRIVYQAGADLYLFDPGRNEAEQIAVSFYSPRVQRQRKFVSARKYLQGYHIHPQGHTVAVTSRGKPFTMANWEGAVVQHGRPHGTRYRHFRWLHDGKRLVVVSDAGGEEALEIHEAAAGGKPQRLDTLDIGRPISLAPSPKKDQVALCNHRHELLLVDLEAQTATVLDHSPYARIYDPAWSPDGRWLAYSFAGTRNTRIIKLCRVETAETWAVTKAVLRDTAPAFDPEGKYLYFLSYRDFTPVYDNLHFDLNFPWGERPYLITLQADTPSPFIPVPRAPGEKINGRGNNNKEGKDKNEEKKEDDIVIDLEGISERVIAFPVAEGRYGRIQGIKGKVLYTVWPLESSLNRRRRSAPPAKATLKAYDFEKQSQESLLGGITNFQVSMNAKTLICRAGNRLRVIEAGEKPDSSSNSPGRKSGWLALSRIRVSVEPQAEWEQMYREAWRWQRDQFWSEDMSGVDWQAVYQRYWPLLRRVATRAEFSDLMWEMQGELGTSHAYESGGDYPPEPQYYQGFLGTDFRYDAATDSYRLLHIVEGDVWDEKSRSPLQQPGIDVRPGDRLVAVGGQSLSREVSPQSLLVNQAGNEVLLTFVRDRGEEEEKEEGETAASFTITVKTLRNETPARYRQWVEANRRYVHDASEGRVGYVHIPNMGPDGYAEFHRSYLAEVDREGLIVDVRFNTGGHVSQLLLEKLGRRRLGYYVSRWGQPNPYPTDSVIGPIVALTNEYAGSDGDIFSHVFKLMDLGPLLGKRTWGGVVGIRVRQFLVDGSVTTQPEYFYWFQDVEWGIENYGTSPDIEVEIRPQDYANGRDPQLERAIRETLDRLAKTPPELPAFDNRPHLPLPLQPR